MEKLNFLPPPFVKAVIASLKSDNSLVVKVPTQKVLDVGKATFRIVGRIFGHQLRHFIYTTALSIASHMKRKDTPE